MPGSSYHIQRLVDEGHSLVMAEEISHLELKVVVKGLEHLAADGHIAGGGKQDDVAFVIG